MIMMHEVGNFFASFHSDHLVDNGSHVWVQLIEFNFLYCATIKIIHSGFVKFNQGIFVLKNDIYVSDSVLPILKFENHLLTEIYCRSIVFFLFSCALRNTFVVDVVENKYLKLAWLKWCVLTVTAHNARKFDLVVIAYQQLWRRITINMLDLLIMELIIST